MDAESELNHKLIEEIEILKKALKYAKAVHHGEMVKLSLKDGICPICGAVPNRENTVSGQEIGSVTSYQHPESPSKTI